MELFQNDHEWDSDESGFLEYEMPKYTAEVPACFCSKVGFCEMH